MLHRTNDPKKLWVRKPPKRKRYPAERIASFIDRLDLGGPRFSAENEAALLGGIAQLEPATRGVHYRVFLILALETAASQAELSGSLWTDFDLDRKIWTVRGKLGLREVPLTPKAMSSLREIKGWAEPARPKLFGAIGDNVVIGRQLQAIARRVGLVDYGYMDLRHEAVCRMVERRATTSIEDLIMQVGAYRTQPPVAPMWK